MRAQGFSYKAISDELKISVTVKSYCRKMLLHPSVVGLKPPPIFALTVKLIHTGAKKKILYG